MAAEPERRPTTRDLVEHLGGTRPSVGWLRTETTAAQGPHDTAPMTAHLPESGPAVGADLAAGAASGPSESGRPSGPSWPPQARTGPSEPGRPAGVGPAAPCALVRGGGSAPSRWRRSWWSASRSASASASSAAIRRPPASRRPSTAASWSGGQRIDTADGLTSVSCASADFCAAADSGGNAFTYSGGSWSAPQRAQQQRTVVGVLPDGRLLRGHQQRQRPVHVRGRQVVAADRAVRRQRQTRSPDVGLLRHRHLLHGDREHARL